MLSAAIRWLCSPMKPPAEAGRWAWDQIDLSLLPADFRAAVARYEAEHASDEPSDCGCAAGAICATNRACPRLAQKRDDQERQTAEQGARAQWS